MEEAAVQDIIKEYLTHHQLNNTLECFEADLKTRHFTNRTTKQPSEHMTDEELADLPRIYAFALGEKSRMAKAVVLEKRLKTLEEKHELLLETSKQIFAITVDTVDRLSDVDDRNPGEKDSAFAYKEQLGKFHKVITTTDTTTTEEDTHTWFSQSNLEAAKQQIAAGLQEKDHQKIYEQLVTIRAKALTAQGKYRRTIVESLVECDVFSGSPLELITLKHYETKMSSLALTSIIASTTTGIRYLTLQQPQELIQTLCQTIKEEEPSSATQRFALATLQKIAAGDSSTLSHVLEAGMVPWVAGEILEKGLREEYVHPFILTFGSALLVNLFNSEVGQQHCDSNTEESIDLSQQILNTLSTDPPEETTTTHLLLVLTAISERPFFIPYIEQLQFSEKLAKFLELFDQGEEEGKEIIREMTAYLLRSREEEGEAGLKLPEPQAEEELEEIIFECFSDETALM